MCRRILASGSLVQVPGITRRPVPHTGISLFQEKTEKACKLKEPTEDWHRITVASVLGQEVKRTGKLANCLSNSSLQQDPVAALYTVTVAVVPSVDKYKYIHMRWKISTTQQLRSATLHGTFGDFGHGDSMWCGGCGLAKDTIGAPSVGAVRMSTQYRADLSVGQYTPKQKRLENEWLAGARETHGDRDRFLLEKKARVGGGQGRQGNIACRLTDQGVNSCCGACY